MNSKILTVGAITAVVAGTFIYGGSRGENSAIEGVQTQSQTTTQTQDKFLASQIKPMGAVDVELTPVKMEPGQNMIFNLSLNTHSVELNYDFRQIITAEDNAENIYKALNWLGGDSGHHLSGKIEFEPLLENARNVKLNISGIDSQSATFEWEL